MDLTESRGKPGQVVVDQRKRRMFAFLFAELERFLDKVVSDTTIPFVQRACTDRGGAYDFTLLASDFFTKVPDYLEVVKCLPPENHYSEHVEAFIACAKEMGLLGQTLVWRDVWDAPSLTYPQFGGISAADLFNLLVAKLRDRCLSEHTKARGRKRRSEAVERAKEYASYVDALFRRYARLVVLRIDLEYRKEVRSQISIVDAMADLNHFFNNQRNNSHFNGKVGFIVKLEYGVQKGLHFHVILFFDGAIRDGRKDVHLVEEIGEYWTKVITKGRGAYWNINANKLNYERLGLRGIGVINAWETNLVANLKHRVVGYLCKSTQYVKLKLQAEQQSGRTIKTIRRGKFPVEPPKKLGRPRKTQELP